MDVRIKGATVNLIAKLLHPLAEAGVLSIPEEREVIAQLRNLAKNGETIPAVLPKLIDQPEAAEMLGISLANFKKLERNGAFPFRRKKIGTAVRYRNSDIIKFILAEEDTDGSEDANGRNFITYLVVVKIRAQARIKKQT